MQFVSCGSSNPHTLKPRDFSQITPYAYRVSRKLDYQSSTGIPPWPHTSLLVGKWQSVRIFRNSGVLHLATPEKAEKELDDSLMNVSRLGELLLQAQELKVSVPYSPEAARGTGGYADVVCLCPFSPSSTCFPLS